jgi:hypothetical protein
MQAPGSVIHFPKQSKLKLKLTKKKPGQKCSVLEWVRNGHQFPPKPSAGGGQ